MRADPVTPGEVWGAWNPDPAVLALAALLAWAYLVGFHTLRQSRRPGRGARGRDAVAFFAGLIVVVGALVSPLDAMAHALLWAHMLQHVLLVVVAAPLLVLGVPRMPLTMATPLRWRSRVRRFQRRWPVALLGDVLTNPLVAWMLAVGVLWAWHVPSLYQDALRRDWLHAVEHATLLGTGVLFWWVAFGRRGRRAIALGADVLFVFTGGLQGAALGALFTFAGAAFYPAYRAPAAAWGMGPLQDQQLAGLIMWIPAGVVYLIAAGVLFVRWLEVAEYEARHAAERVPMAARKGVPP